MAKVVTDSIYYQTIAELLRAEAYSEELTQKRYKPSEMAGGVTRVADENRESGMKMGETIGENRVLNAIKRCFEDRNYAPPDAVVDAYSLTNGAMLREYYKGRREGKQEEYDRFWDSYQQNGQRTDYYYAFRNPSVEQQVWTADNFEPKYSMSPTNLQQAFGLWTDGKVDFGALFTDRGLEFDTSNCVNFYQTWYDSIGIVRMPVIDTSKATNISRAFTMRNLVTFDKFIPPKTKVQNGINTAFNGCYALENIVVEGDILQDINFSYSSKLTHDSLMSILGALVNNTEGTTLTCTLGATNLAKLTDEEKAIATQKGWTLA
ncbi:MAG: hypothetical protein IJZ48_01035 [Oscillospiraceae bacterium]|nr:hypothetical protein [Oscillospiraceae bacterium]